ncbi:MAG TPA: ATP-binding protein [Candidatus Binatia bacterium]|nr:ATP-binding protein [Candidatus Binatia bacterium]
MATWWGIGLPYSVFAWLLDAQQLRWVLICYAWEVPVAGVLGPLLFPLLWWRAIERRWDAVFAGADPEPGTIAALEAALLDFPLRVAWVFVITSLVGYGIGALQVRLFASLPLAEVYKIFALGLVTGVVGGLFAFLYLEWRLGALVRAVGARRGAAPPAGRRVPLFAKVFGGSLVLTVTALLLLGTIFYSGGERILEEQLGDRLLVETRQLAADVAAAPSAATDGEWWRRRTARIDLGPSGEALLVEADGTVVAGTGAGGRLADRGLRAPAVAAVSTGGARHVVDRVGVPRVVAGAPVPGTSRRVLTVVLRREFAAVLDAMLARGTAVLALALLLAFVQGLLFSRRLMRPIETVTQMAGEIAAMPRGPWARLAVRTNDEVGALAAAFDRMAMRLEETHDALDAERAALERRIEEATRQLGLLYDVTRTTTATLELDDVLALVARKLLGALGLARVVLLWRAPEEGAALDAYVATAAHGTRLEVDDADLAALSAGRFAPAVEPLGALRPLLPVQVAGRLGGPDVLVLPLVLKDALAGLLLADRAGDSSLLDLDLAGVLASQAAAALANASLFETVRRHETELRRLSQLRVQLQEEGLRTLSRELHDGVGQMLAAIKMDLASLERTSELDRDALRARLREVRDQVTDLQQEIRSLSQLLRPSMLDDFGLVPTLQWLVEKFTSRTGLPVALTTPPAETRLPAAIEVLLYRVTQEALTNVVKHARARRVEVALAVREGEAELRIADDGIGFDVERLRRAPGLGGAGLLGMRERVAYYRGRIEIRSRPRAGVQILLTIPLAPAKSAQRTLPLAG